MKKQRIRALEEQDLDQVIEIWLHVNLAAHSFIPADYWKSHYQEVKEALSEAEVYVACGEKNNQILGFAGLDGNYIAGLFVAEKWQSHGIGKALINYIKEIRDSLELHVFFFFLGAVRFYKREGFRIREEQLGQDTGKKE